MTPRHTPQQGRTTSMTALFAYADNEVAFIASDTCRAQGIMQFVAAKTSQWSDVVLIAQTGFGEGLQRLSGEMKARQHLRPEWRGLQGVEDLFTKHRAYRLEFERHHNKTPNTINGTLLAVQAGTFRGPPRIATYDWVSGSICPQALPVYADGTNAPLFNQIAQGEFAKMSSSSNLDLGDWAVRCMKVVKTDPGMVNIVEWPVDLSIIRRDHGSLVHITQRVEAENSKRHPAFTL